MFKDVEQLFSVLEHMFNALEHMFNALEHKNGAAEKKNSASSLHCKCKVNAKLNSCIEGENAVLLPTIN